VGSNVSRGLDVAFRLQGDPQALDAVAEAAGNLTAAQVAADRKELLEWRIFRIDQLDGGSHYRLAVRHPARWLDLGLEKELRRELAHRCTEPPERLLAEYAHSRTGGLTAVPLKAIPETVDYWADPLWVRIGTMPPANPPP
jgi:hypothetical protein